MFRLRMIAMEWKVIGRPGFFGDKRDEIFRQYDEKYGAGNWEIAWLWSGRTIPFEIACQIYEDSYYADSFLRGDLWKDLVSVAKDVYDHTQSNVNSGLDYSVQEGTATHLQDIAIRRVVLRRGWDFEGDELVQIRSHKTYWGGKLSPGRVPFHLPHLIEVPHIAGWYDSNSVEDFYQSNKVLRVKDKI